MHAYLIVGNDADSVNKKVEELVKKNEAKRIEFPLAKISDVRELEKFTSRSRSKTVIVSKDIDQSTHESLNAFLKNLEEPNPNILFVLTARNINNIIPTIVSRCEVINLNSNEFQVSDRSLVKKFLKGDTGEKLAIIDTIKKKEDALVFTKDLITYLHLSLNKAKDKHLKYAKFLRAIQKTYNAINANGNVGLQLTNLVVKLGSI